MLIENMQVGKTLEILLIREGYKYRFVSKIEGVAGSAVAVSLIANASRAFHFEDKDDISIIYRGTERMWKWDHVKGGMAKLDGYPVHTFASYAEGKSYNRREAFRVPIGEPILMNKVIKLEKDEEKETKTEQKEKLISFEALLSDLSANGAGLYSNEKLEKGAEIAFDMPTNLGVLSCRGSIVREAEVFDRPFRHFYGCDFSKVSSGLERYLTEKQRLILQKERSGDSVRKL